MLFSASSWDLVAPCSHCSCSVHHGIDSDLQTEEIESVGACVSLDMHGGCTPVDPLIYLPPAVVVLAMNMAFITKQTNKKNICASGQWCSL